jgi:hypothetical protein
MIAFDLDLDLGHAATRATRRAEVGAVEQSGGARRPQGALHALFAGLEDQRRRPGVTSGEAGLDDDLAVAADGDRPDRGLTPPNVVTCSTTSDAPEGCGIRAAGRTGVAVIVRASATETTKPGDERMSGFDVVSGGTVPAWRYARRRVGRFVFA